MTAQPLSYARPLVRVPRPFVARLVRPAGMALIALAASATVTTLYATSGMCDNPGAGFAMAFGWLVLLCLWSVRGVGRVLGVYRYGTPARVGRSLPWRWAVVPLLAAGTAWLSHLGVANDVAFYFSRPALDRAARAALASPASRQRPVHIGLFGTATPQVEGGAVAFEFGGMGGISDRGGLVYSPSPSTTWYWYDCRHLGGSWYTWYRQ